MKKRIFLVMSLLLICFFVFPGTVSAEEELYVKGTCGEDVTWVLEEGGLYIKGDGPMDDYLDSAAPWIEYADVISSVFIEEGVTTVGSGAFQNCTGIVNISLPHSLTHIGDYAFYGCTKLLDVYIWESLEYIGNYAFAGCTNLNSLYIGGSVKEIKTGAFSGDSKLSKIQMQNKVEVIGKEAFLNCGISKLQLPASITKIGANAFSGNKNLSEITFKGSVPKISSNSFTGVKATAYYSMHDDSWTSEAKQNYGGTLTWKKQRFWTDSGYCDMDVYWYYDEVDGYLQISGTYEINSRQRGWRIYRDSIKTVVIEEGIIGYVGGFEDCVVLNKVTLPNTVTGLENYAFKGCVALTDITLPDSITVIGSEAFSGCKKLKNVTLPKKLELIGIEAFKDCTALTKITLPKSVETVNTRAFIGCINLTSISVSKYNTSLESDDRGVLFNEKMTEIVSVPGGLTGEYSIPSGVVNIQVGTFDGCNMLTAIKFPKTVKNIYGGFMDCAALASVQFSEGLEQIQPYAFYNCPSLKEVTIPASVKHLWGGAIKGCASLKTIYFMGDTPPQAILGAPFGYIEAKAYYPAGEKWTKEVRNQLGPNFTWINSKPATPKLTVSGSESTGKPVLKWGKVEGAVEYQLYRKIGADGKYEKIATATGTSYTDKTAEAGIKYYYRMRAVSETGVKSDYCGGKARTCDLPQPAVTASNTASTGRIKLSWNKVAGASKYYVYRWNSKTEEYDKIKTTTSASYTDTTAVAGTSYTYRVTAVHENSSANSAKSEKVKRTCDLAQPVVEETNVSSSGKVKLEWQKIEGTEKYKIYRRVGKTGDYEYYKSTTSTSFTDNDNKAGTVYYYKVKAAHSNSSADSAKSDAVGQTCKLARPDVTIALSSGNPKLTWEKVSGTTEYKVYRATSKDGTYKSVKTTTSTSFTDKDVTAGKTYYYKVKAIHSNSSANSAYSSVDYIKAK